MCRKSQKLLTELQKHKLFVYFFLYLFHFRGEKITRNSTEPIFYKIRNVKCRMKTRQLDTAVQSVPNVE